MNLPDGSFTVAVPESILEQFQYVKEIYSYSGRVAEGLGRRVAWISDHKNAERMDLCVKLYAFNGITQRLGVLCRIPDHEFRSVQTGLVRQILEYAALGSVRTINIENVSTDPNAPKPQFVDRRTRKPIKTYGSAFVAKFLLGGSLQLRRNIDTIYRDTSGFVHPSAHECLTYVLKRDGSGYLHNPMGIQGYADLLMSVVGNLCIMVDQQHHLRVFSERELVDWKAKTRRRYERRNSLTSPRPKGTASR